MSYSFSVKAATKEEAKEGVAKQIEQVAASQPIHAKDLPSAQAAAGAFIDILDHEVGKEISLSMSGSVSYKYNPGGEEPISQANLNINVSSAWITPA